MRGIFVFHRDRRGGGCNSFHLLIQGLRKRFLSKEQISIVFPEQGFYLNYYTREGYQCHFINKFPSITASHLGHRTDIVLNRLKFCVGLLQIIHRQQPDFVYINSFVNSSAYLSARLSSKPLVWHIRESNDILFSSRLSGVIRRFLLRSFSGPFVSVSHSTEGLIRKLNPDAWIDIVHNGIDLPKHGVSSYSVKDEVVIGFSGSIVKRKGVDILVEAFRILCRDYPKVQLFIAGPKLDKFLFQKLCARIEGVQSQVTFLGFVADMSRFYQGIDIFVLPSRHEPFSRSLLEAMSYGLPVVASDVDGNPEAIEDGVSGLTFEMGNPKDLAVKLERLLDDVKMREALGQAARKRVEEYFSMKQYINGIVDVIEELLIAGR